MIPFKQLKDAHHNPEFTMMELYWAYRDYADMMRLTEQIFCYLAQQVHGELKILSRVGDSKVKINLTPPWECLTIFEAIRQYTGEDVSQVNSQEYAMQIAERLGVKVNDAMSIEEIIIEIFDERVQKQLIQPTFITDYFSALCPLMKRHRENPRLAERFELFIHGLEFANAYSELTDPREQAHLFALQANRRASGDEEAHMTDEDFLTALEYGMPPTGGLGIGIDRLVMLLLGASNIRDIILFPISRSMHSSR